MSGLVISIPHVGNDPNPVELICLENTHYVSNSIDNNKHAWITNTNNGNINTGHPGI